MGIFYFSHTITFVISPQSVHSSIEGVFDDDGVMVGIFIDMHGQLEGSFKYKEVW